MNWLQWLNALALILGGFWVLYNYFLRRTHKARLQLRVSAERVLREKEEFLIIKTELKNVGLVRVNIVKGCAITLYAHRLPKRVASAMEPKWDRLETFDLYKDQHWVEPTGLLLDSQLVALPDGAQNRFLRVWARFAAPKVVLNAFVVVGPEVRRLKIDASDSWK